MTSAQSAASRSRSRPARKTAPFSRLARAAIALAVCAALDPAYAQVGANTLPQGPRVNTGAATVGTSGSKMTVTQTTPKVSLGWESFSIGSKSSVTFVQPSSSSVALNRVLGSDPSWIYGSLSANGKVFLINQAGVLFAPGARVNVGGIAASTLDMSDTDFMAGRYVFSGDSTASVVNRGSIITSPGGYAALIGNNVANEGTISASGGSVALAAGSRVTMDLTGDGLLSISVDAASVRAMASNTGLIQADGGRVILSARAADALAGTVLNQAGIVEARSGSMRNGEIVLDGGNNGIVAVSGKMDVSGTQPGATGGKVTVTGNLVGLYGADINASGDAGGGTILIGGDYQGKNPDVQNAFRTYVDGGSHLNADAVTTGNGGKVIVWADDATAFYGSIIARGGAQGGDGGFAEVSGKQSLVYAGFTDLRAPLGNMGTLLLDPADIVIDSSGTNPVSDGTFFNSGPGGNFGNAGTVTITPTDLVFALNGSNVQLQANNDITVQAAVDASGGGPGSLYLEAGKSINVQANISLNGNFTAIANTNLGGVSTADRSAGNGAFTMNNGTSIDTSTGNGDIQISVLSGAAPTFNSGSITIANLNAGGGNVWINQGGQTPGSHILRTTNSAIAASSVSLEITNAANTSGTIGNVISGPIVVTSGIVATPVLVSASTKNGAIFLESDGPLSIGDAVLGSTPGINAGTGNVTITSNEAITQTQAMSGNTLTVKTLLDGGAPITLNHTGNEFAFVDLKARDSGDANNDAGAISYRDATGFDVNAAHSTSTVNLVGGGAITDGASGTLTGSVLTVKTLNDAGAAITLDNATNAFSSVNLQARNTTDLDNTDNAAGTITYVNTTGFTAAARSASTVNLTATTGNITVDATPVTGSIITDGGAVTLTASAANASIISASGGDIITNNNVPAGAAVTLRADNLSLAGAITAGAGLVTLTPNTNAVAIQVGLGATDGLGVLGITDVELATIATTGGLTIGSTTNTGGITVVGTASAPGVTGGTFTLRSDSGQIVVNNVLSPFVDTTLQTNTGNISFGASGSVSVPAINVVNLIATGGNIEGSAGPNVVGGTLNATALSGIGNTTPLTSQVSTLTFANTSNAVQVINAAPGATSVAVSGTNPGSGAVNITETAGDLTIGAADILTNSGAVTLTNSAPTKAIISVLGSNISTTGGATAGAAVNLIADNMDLAGATGSGTATTTLRQFTNTRQIDLGVAAATGTKLELTSAEINTITAGKIKIGDSNSGDITVTLPIAPTGTTLLSLESGGSINQAADATITEINLALRAGTGINLNDNPLAGTANAVDNLGATSATGGITFYNGTSLTVGTVDGLNGATTTTSGAIDIMVSGNSAGALTLFVDNVTAASGGAITLTALNAGAGTGNIFEAPLGGTGDIGIDIATTGTLTMNATTQIGQPAVPAGTPGPIEISVGTLVPNSGVGGVYLTQTGDVTLGSFITNGNFAFTTIGTVTVGGTMRVDGDTTLVAQGTNSDVIVSNAITRVNDNAGNFIIQADRHIVFNTATTNPGTTIGSFTAQNANPGGLGAAAVTLNSDRNADGNGAIYINAGSTITSNDGSVTLGGALNPASIAAIGSDTSTGFNATLGTTANLMRNGVVVEGQINAGAGNISIRGQSLAPTPLVLPTTFYSSVAGVVVRDTGAANSGDISTTTGNIFIGGASNQGAGDTQGVLITGPGTTITSTHPSAGGSISIGGVHVSPTTGNNNVGVLVSNGAVISSVGTSISSGTVTLGGIGASGAGDGDSGVVITGNGTTVSVVGALLNINGTGGGGGATGGASNVGVQIGGGAIVETIGTGVVSLSGTGGATDGGGNHGIEVTGSGTQLRSTFTGASALRLNLVGTGGAGAGNGDNGVLIDNLAQVSTVTGHVAFTGTGGGGGGADNTNIGVSVANSASVTTTSAGNIAFTGTGGASTGGTNYGIAILSGGIVDSTLTVAGAGTITFSGTGGAGAGSNDTGIFLSSFGTPGTRVRSTVGNISFTGTGGADTTGGSNNGIHVSNSAVVETLGSAQITLDGTGSATANGGNNFGVVIDTSGVVRSTGLVQTGTSGKITVIGHGGLGTGAGDGGIQVASGGAVRTVDAEIEFQGTGGNGAIAGTSYGIFIDSGVVSTTGDGTILLTGTGGATPGGSNVGIFTQGTALIESTAANAVNPAGTITLSGLGGAGAGNGDIGIAITQSSTVSSKDGLIAFFGTGGAAGGTRNYGIQIAGTGAPSANVTSTGLATIGLTGTGGAGADGNRGVSIETGAAVRGASTSSGNITIAGTAGGTANSNQGVVITTNLATVESLGTGNIGITGIASGTGARNIGVMIDDSGIVATAKTGTVNITGTGAGTGAGNIGVRIGDNALVASTQSTAGGGTITILGTGAAGTSGNDGVRLVDIDGGANASGTAAAVTSVTGAISITGNRGNATGAGNIGVNLAQNALVQNQNATTTILGQGAAAAATNANYGVAVNLGSSVQTTGTGAINITGTGAGTGTDNVGVLIGNNSLVASTQPTAGGGGVVITGTGAAGTSSNDGVRMVDLDGGANASGTAAAITSLTGAISITGNRGDASTDSNIGVNLKQNAFVQNQNANTTILGQGTANSSQVANYGVVLDLGSTVQSTGTGSIGITGFGAGSVAYNIGVAIGDDSRVISTSGTGGSITITGTGSGSSIFNDGVRITDGNGATIRAGATSANGAISITGNRGAVTGNDNNGVFMNGTTLVESTGAGGITIVGQSATASLTDGTTQNFGVQLNSGSIVRTTTTGNISITGTGSGTAGGTSYNPGVHVGNGSIVESQQTTAGAGTITITGTGATSAGNNDFGVQIYAASVLSKAGNITIAGTAQGSGVDDAVLFQNGAIIGSTTGADATGSLSIIGNGNSGGIAVVGAGAATNTIGGATWAGPLTITGQGTNAGVVLDFTNVTTKGATANVLITSLDGVTLGGAAAGNVDAGASTVTITTNTDGTAVATEGFTQASGGITTTNNTASAVSITANTAGGGTGDILFRGITANGGTTATITLNSNAGSINEQADGLGLLTAQTGNVVLTATGTGVIGFKGTTNRNPVRTDTANITATTTNGTISILDSGTIAGVNFLTVTTGNNNQIDLQALAGDMTMGTIGTAATNTGAVNILARAGSILNDASTATRITGGTVTLNASNSIGASGNFLDTTATAIAAKSGSAAGGTFISETDGVDLTETTLFFAGTPVNSVTPQSIFTNHSAQGTYNLIAGGSITTSATSGFTLNGDTTITATGAASDITISNSITQNNAAAKSLQLIADNSVIFNSGADLTSIGAGALAVTFNSDRDASGAGAISLGSGTVVSTAANGGAVVLGGGATPATVAAMGTAANVEGVRLNNAQILSGAGAITITGKGLSTAGDNRHGVSIDSGSIVQSSTGLITVTGTGGAGTNLNIGVNVEGTNSRITSTGAGGNILVTGIGGAGSGDSNVGVAVRGGAPKAKIEALGSGTVTVTGTRGNGVNNNESVYIDGTVSSNTGALQISGNAGGTVSGAGNEGVVIAGGTVTSNAALGITGTGGAGTTNNPGVWVTGNGLVNAPTTAVTILGTGAGTGGNNAGVQIDTGGIVTTISGSVTINGFGANIAATDAGIWLAGGGTVSSTGSGSLALLGTGGAGAPGILSSGGSNTIGSGTMTGEILLRSLNGTGTVSDATILNDGSAGTVVTLNADGGGGFNLTGGSVTSDGLRFLGSGTFSVTDPGGVNAVNKIAGTLADTSAVTYVQAGTVEVASLTSFQDGVGINQTTSNGFDIAGVASSLSIASGGITQASNAPIVVPGTTTLIDGGNNIVLNNPGNLFGTVNVDSANNVTLGGTSIGLGNVFPSNNLTINAGTLTDSGTVIVPGLATFNVTGNMLLDSPNSDFNKVTFNVGGDATLVDVNDLVVNTSTIGGNLALTTGGSLNTTPFNIVTVGGNVTFNVGTGGLGTLNNDFHLNTPGSITLTITGTVPPFTVVSGFVVNDGSGLLVLLPPTQLVRFNVVEFQPPTPVTAAMYVSKEYADVPLEDLTDLIYVTDDPNEQEYPGVRGRIGRVAAGADVHRDGGIRMPPGLVSTGGGQPAPDAGFEPVRGSRFLFRN